MLPRNGIANPNPNVKIGGPNRNKSPIHENLNLCLAIWPLSYEVEDNANLLKLG